MSISPITSTPAATPTDPVFALPPRDRWTKAARKRRDIYALVPGAAIPQLEFGFMEGTLDAWREQGMTDRAELGLEPDGCHRLGQLGWCEAAFSPGFDQAVLEDRGDCELVRDFAGRSVLCFKGRRQGFMPEYVDHPVKDEATWEQDVAWRLDPATPERYADLDRRMDEAKAAAARGEMIVASLIGGYMYLRSLFGPEKLLYAFCDQPELIHRCMKTWLDLADAVTARHQQHVTIDEVFLAEDICYNAGPLISPDMMREFLLPYYQRLIDNIRARQGDPGRKLHISIDTDGNVAAVIDVYREIGMTCMTPFEVASGCNVVEIGRRYPDLVMLGGIDKRVLAEGKQSIEEMVERIIPPLKRRGGYIPLCDHAVPIEVPLEHYLYYRRRCTELGS